MGLFIQRRLVLRQPLLSARGAALPWPYRSVIEWWPDVLPQDVEARRLATFVQRAGEPALEVGFGSGQRVSHCRAVGIDIDGIEPSRGLYAIGRERIERQGLSRHRLYSQPLHEIDLPRRYRSIYAGRVIGTGASVDADAVALFRLYRALEPGGTLLFEHPAPWGDRSRWLGRFAPLAAPRRWPPALVPCELRSASDAEVLQLSSAAYDPGLGASDDAGALTFSVQARHLQQGELASRRGFVLRQRFYAPRELAALLVRAGFDEARVASVYVPEAQRYLWMAEKVQRWRAAPAWPLGPLGPLGLTGSIGARANGSSF
ncbi:MAG TPA: class I SAM-dependent methyltransferase [Polyangiaceae bacterium]|nr:class I SAM-dependent methyltransferase [Polyangiaceae bacterium]